MSSDKNHLDEEIKLPSKLLRIRSAFINPKTGDHYTKILHRVAGTLSVPFVGLILLLGFFQLFNGIAQFFGLNFSKEKISLKFWKVLEFGLPDPHGALPVLLESLEFFLLAPLFYLQLRTVGNFLSGFHLSTGDEPEKERKDIGNRVSALLTVKALSVGLLITILGTNLVSDFLTYEVVGDPIHQNNIQEFPWIKSACGIGVIFALGLYLTILEKAAKSAGGE